MSNKELRFLFLYTRLPEYFYQCIVSLVNRKGLNARVIIYCYPKDANAPYEFSVSDDRIKIYAREELNLNAVASFNPSVIYLAGWGDKGYNKVASHYRPTIPVIIGMDNPWKGTIRQQIASITGKVWLKNLASFIWIPGYPQFEFGRRLGFLPGRILKGLYCANTGPYEAIRAGFHKRILYVGRLVDYKRPDWILEAFERVIADHPSLREWKLTIIGNGPMEKELKTKYGTLNEIEFISFLQPEQLPSYYGNAGIFCLPSNFEHWGVVVHEAATAGLPMLLSDTCGAASEFLIPTYNGLIFRSDSKSDFRNKLLQLMLLPDETLLEMGKSSKVLARRINQDMWVSTILGSLEQIA